MTIKPSIGGTVPALALPLASPPAPASAPQHLAGRDPHRLSTRPTRRTYFRFATWACRRASRPSLEDVMALWAQGNAALAQEWLDDLHMALSAPDPEDDIAPCIAEKFGDIAHDHYQSTRETDA